MTPTTGAHVDLQTAADELGVHYQTAYRWVRSGRLPAQRVDGKYLVARADLVDVERSRRAPDRPPAPGHDRLDRTAQRLLRALIDGDEPTVRRSIRRLVDEGTPLIELIEQVLVPPLREIGERWHRGELSIWVEHRSSAIVERLLGDIVPNPRGRRRGTAVVCAVAGDLHALPTTMAAVALRADQWNVHHLGADVPADQIEACCADNDVDLLVLSVTNPGRTGAAASVAERVRSAGVAVLTGAPGGSLAGLVLEAREAKTAAGEAASLT